MRRVNNFKREFDFIEQYIDDSTEFLFYENWVSKEAHENHVRRPEVQNWRSELDNFLEKPYEVSFWEII